MYLIDKNLMPTQKAAPKPYTLESLIAWLETKEGNYDFLSTNNCLLCQYTESVQGKKVDWMDVLEAFGHGNRMAQIVAYGSQGVVKECMNFEHSFNAALARARAIQ